MASTGMPRIGPFAPPSNPMPPPVLDHLPAWFPIDPVVRVNATIVDDLMDETVASIQGAKVSLLWDVSRHRPTSDLQAAPWSILDLCLAASTRWSYASLRRFVNKAIAAKDSSQPAQFAPSAADAPAMMASYVSLMDGSSERKLYTRVIRGQPIDSPFAPHIAIWWQFHQRSCAVCRSRGPYASAARSNHLNPCWFSYFLPWLHYGFIAPFTETPPAHRPVANAPSLSQAPSAVNAEFDRMIAEDNIREGSPTVTSPMLLVIRDSDLDEAKEALRARDVQFSPAASVDDLNALLAAFPPPVPKKIKARLAINFGRFVNPYLPHWPFSYVSIHDACSIVEPGWFMAKLDLTRMYNTIPRHRAHWDLFGLRFRNTTWIGNRILFGESEAPAMASTFSAIVSAMLWSFDIPNVIMLDDIFIVGPSYAICQARLLRAIAILTLLGWSVNRAKTEGPAQSIAFLGILINTLTMRLSFASVKLQRVADRLCALLLLHVRGAVTVRKLRSMLGRLENIASVLTIGRVYLRRLWTSLPFHAANSRQVTLSAGAVDDLNWWLQTLRRNLAEPSSAFWSPIWVGEPQRLRVFSDAADASKGFSLLLHDTIYQGRWSSAAHGKSSAWRELLPTLVAIRLLVRAGVVNSLLILTSDNISVVQAINKGAAKANACVPLLRLLFQEAADNGLLLLGNWIPRGHNQFCDFFSKVFELDDALQSAQPRARRRRRARRA